MLQRALIFVTAVIFAIFSSTSQAQFGESSSVFQSEQVQFLEVEDAYSSSAYLSSNELSVIWDTAPNYYLYQHMFSGSITQGSDTQSIEFNFPEGLLKYDEIFARELVVYYDSVELTATLPSISPGDILSLNFQGCADAGLCYPPDTRHYKYLGNGQFQPSAAPETNVNSFVQTNTPTEGFAWWMILSALLGGLILNAMPCVFPVIALKATSFVNSGSSARSHAWAYTAGVVGSFLAFAVAIILLAKVGTSVGWGFHLQSPITIAALSYLFTAMAVVLVLDLPIAHKLMGIGSNVKSGSSKRASFFTGLLAVVVASPCTAPFMGVAMGAALTQSAFATITVFAAIGLGLALPILLLSYWPALIAKLPKPGAWMVTARELMFFPLIATAIYLIWVLGQQVGITGATEVTLGSLALAMAIWSYSKGSQVAKIIAAVIAAIAFTLISPSGSSSSSTSEGWTDFSPEVLSEARRNGPVFVDVTAAWCITCIANRSAIESDAVSQFFADNNVALIEADWTTPDQEITDYLAQFGRAGVPLYVYYPANSNSAVVLPQILTPDVILNNLQ